MHQMLAMIQKEKQYEGFSISSIVAKPGFYEQHTWILRMSLHQEQ